MGTYGLKNFDLTSSKTLGRLLLISKTCAPIFSGPLGASAVCGVVISARTQGIPALVCSVVLLSAAERAVLSQGHGAHVQLAIWARMLAAASLEEWADLGAVLPLQQVPRSLAASIPLALATVLSSTATAGAALPAWTPLTILSLPASFSLLAKLLRRRLVVLAQLLLLDAVFIDLP